MALLLLLSIAGGFIKADHLIVEAAGIPAIHQPSCRQLLGPLTSVYLGQIPGGKFTVPRLPWEGLQGLVVRCSIPGQKTCLLTWSGQPAGIIHFQSSYPL